MRASEGSAYDGIWRDAVSFWYFVIVMLVSDDLGDQCKACNCCQAQRSGHEGDSSIGSCAGVGVNRGGTGITWFRRSDVYISE